MPVATALEKHHQLRQRLDIGRPDGGLEAEVGERTDEDDDERGRGRGGVRREEEVGLAVAAGHAHRRRAEEGAGSIG